MSLAKSQFIDSVQLKEKKQDSKPNKVNGIKVNTIKNNINNKQQISNKNIEKPNKNQ